MDPVINNTPQRHFKGIWIPANIWLDNTLSYFERCLLAEIHSLQGEDGCFASNEYLAKFFNERERKIQEGLSLLKARGYISLKSFNGRQRILTTDLNPKNDKSLFSTSEVRNSAPQTCGNPHPSSIYIDTSIDKRIETSLKVPEEPTANAVMSAKADEVEDHSPPIKKLKTEPSPEVKELAIAILSAMRDIKPDYKAPSSTAAIETQIDLMIRCDKRKPQEIIDVIKWALCDAFWVDKMFKPNPAKYLREKFDQLSTRMITALPQKERKFAPSSDTKRAKQAMDNAGYV